MRTEQRVKVLWPPQNISRVQNVITSSLSFLEASIISYRCQRIVQNNQISVLLNIHYFTNLTKFLNSKNFKFWGSARLWHSVTKSNKVLMGLIILFQLYNNPASQGLPPAPTLPLKDGVTAHFCSCGLARLLGYIYFHYKKLHIFIVLLSFERLSQLKCSCGVDHSEKSPATALKINSYRRGNSGFLLQKNGADY